MTKKGFSLIELLAVILIIGLLGMLVLRNVDKLRSSYGSLSNDELNEIIETSAQSYIMKDKSKINTLKSGKSVTVNLKTLVERGYLSEKNLQNPSTNADIDYLNSSVIIKYDLNTYKYIYELNIKDK